MALSYSGTGQYSSTTNSSQYNASTPYTVSLWIKPSGNDDSYDWYLEVGDCASAQAGVGIQESDAGGELQAWVWNSGVYATEIGTAFSYTNDVWVHVAIVVSGSQCEVFYNGSSNGTVAEVPDSNANDDITVAASRGGSQLTDADFAEIAYYNVALGSAEVSALADGASPLLIRPGSLVEAFPLVNGSVNGLFGDSLSNTGSPSAAEHPSIIMPRRGLVVPTPAAAAPAPSFTPRVIWF